VVVPQPDHTIFASWIESLAPLDRSQVAGTADLKYLSHTVRKMAANAQRASERGSLALYSAVYCHASRGHRRERRRRRFSARFGMLVYRTLMHPQKTKSPSTTSLLGRKYLRELNLVAGSTGLEPAASGATGANPRSRSFDVSRFSSGIRAIANHAPPSPRTDRERHLFCSQNWHTYRHSA
jgi:hypothetical protein